MFVVELSHRGFELPGGISGFDPSPVRRVPDARWPGLPEVTELHGGRLSRVCHKGGGVERVLLRGTTPKYSWAGQLQKLKQKGCSGSEAKPMGIGFQEKNTVENVDAQKKRWDNMEKVLEELGCYPRTQGRIIWNPKRNV